jgi:ubiquinone/menaquinone biosynthesis C-methylase UbiE
VADIVRGAIPSPNIWHHTHAYEIENHAVDRAGRLETAMAALRPFGGATVLDVGCGTGFHLPRFVQQGAAHVIGVEPHGALAAGAARRCRSLPTVEVRHGSAQALPVADRSVDVSHARWAYFFGPGCEPGLRELRRVMRRGGRSFVIDVDATRSTFGRWFAAAHPAYDATAVQRFWSRQGWQRQPVDLTWSFDSRSDLAAVVRIEFAPKHAERILAEHTGLELDYAANLWWRAW